MVGWGFRGGRKSLKVQETVVVCIAASLRWDGNESVRFAKPEGNGKGGRKEGVSHKHSKCQYILPLLQRRNKWPNCPLHTATFYIF
jgi:hypothetical protein